jgi:hypothetical protein
LSVINQAGRGVTLPVLADLADRWVANRADQEAPLCRQARVLSERMMAAWPINRWYRRRDREPTEVGWFLGVLLRLGDTTGLEAFLTALAGRHGFDVGNCPAISWLCGAAGLGIRGSRSQVLACGGSDPRRALRRGRGDGKARQPPSPDWHQESGQP